MWEKETEEPPGARPLLLGKLLGDQRRQRPLRLLYCCEAGDRAVSGGGNGGSFGSTGSPDRGERRGGGGGISSGLGGCMSEFVHRLVGGDRPLLAVLLRRRSPMEDPGVG